MRTNPIVSINILIFHIRLLTLDWLLRVRLNLCLITKRKCFEALKYDITLKVSQIKLVFKVKLAYSI